MFPLAGIALGLVLELSYYTWVYSHFPPTPPPAQLVAVYSGADDRTGWIREWGKANSNVVFLFSGWDFDERLMETTTGLPSSRIILETRSWTTDQNARYSAPLIKQTGMKEIVLALPWYHLPRALFLTRYYLWGSGISVEAYASTPLPPGWFLNHWFWIEWVKFWGSLGRIGLSWFGIDNWPHHF